MVVEVVLQKPRRVVLVEPVGGLGEGLAFVCTTMVVLEESLQDGKAEPLFPPDLMLDLVRPLFHKPVGLFPQSTQDTNVASHTVLEGQLLKILPT